MSRSRLSCVSSVLIGLTSPLTVAMLALPARAAEVVLMPAGSVWKYLDDGTDPGTAWRERVFDDSTWPAGPAELGVGDGDEATPITSQTTTYFRPTLDAVGPRNLSRLVLRVKRDDGAVVYFNGTEVFRTNMPEGPIAHQTPALSETTGEDEDAWFETFLDSALLPPRQTRNVFAVEVHQHAGGDPDVSFDFELIALTGLLRGPYLQLGTPTSVLVRWRTDDAVDSRVQYGTECGALTQTVVDAAPKTEHAILLTGLSPETQYFYSIGTTSYVLAGGDPETSFVTAPLQGTRKPTRIWVLGDSGTKGHNARIVRDAYAAYTGTRRTDLWLMLGDNAYDAGTDAEYQLAVFEMYPDTLRSAVLWPTLGNHDASSADSATQSGVYYDIFTLPAAAEAGGLASGTEAYYAFDHGNVHFICLDSSETSPAVGGPMWTWLEADLAATNQDWVIAFWHHPPYSKGSHDSDAEGALINMRQNVLPVLEDGGVDLVLTGHSHSYERSFLLDGHYGVSRTLTEEMKLDDGDGRVDGDGAYHKATFGAAGHEGAVYAVAGCSGWVSGGPLNHPAMYISLNVLGSMVLDVDGNQLDAVFLDSTGTVQDSFTIIKGATSAPAVSPRGLAILPVLLVAAGTILIPIRGIMRRPAP